MTALAYGGDVPRPSWSELAWTALALVLAGNALSLVKTAGGAGSVAGWLVVPLAVAAVAWARWREGLSWCHLGVSAQGLGKALLLGTGTGFTAALVAAVGLAFPPLLGGPVTYAAASDVPLDALLWRVLVTMPLDTVLVEELIFRGIVLQVLLRRLPLELAVLAGALLFTLWHPAIIVLTLRGTNLTGDPLFFSLGLAGAHLVVFVAGVGFAALRLAGGHLAAPAAAHWVANGGILLALRALGGGG